MTAVSSIAPVERRFDPDYYRGCYEHLLPRDADPESHFRKTGHRLGFNPNPFFSTRWYTAVNPTDRRAKGGAFAQFLGSPLGQQVVNSVVFDPEYYLLNNSDLPEDTNPFDHFAKFGRFENRSPNILFDIDFYRRQLDGSARTTDDLLHHYLVVGWKANLSPHPLFDPEYYRSQLSEAGQLVPPLAHYLETGWRTGLSPHSLFDPAYYAHNLGQVIEEPALVHYLKQDTWSGTPHYLFSDAYYARAAREFNATSNWRAYRGEAPLLHYVKTGARHGISPHPLFDVHHYRHRVERRANADGALKRETLLEDDALRHYVEFGIEDRISPSPLFDFQFYLSQWPNEIAGDPVRHYLLRGYKLSSPHPAVDISHYASNKPDFSPHELPVILDLLLTPQGERTSPHPSFDVEFYRDRNLDLADTCPIMHFIQHGMREARQPNRLFTYPYAHRLCKPQHPQFWNPVDGYFRARGSERPRVVFLGHDASRSGAPLVLLALIQQLAATNSIECITILGRGGPLVDDYVECSLTYVVENQDREFLEWGRHSPAFLAELSKIAEYFRGNEPVLVICNSLESRHLADFFVSHGFGPLVTLVHEVADPYHINQVSKLLIESSQSIFVSEYQFGRMQKKLAFDESKTQIVKFGALDNRFGRGDPALASRKVRAELGIGESAKIVLGCATMNFRKGVDLFAEMACDALARIGDTDDVHFVWVGEGETHYDSAFYWADKAIQDHGFEERVHFLGARNDTEPYFLTADIFVLTSRADPYPCVIQEAMACGLPVVAFADKSGAAEAIGDSGITVPFHPVAMAEAVCRILRDDTLRAELSRRARALHVKKPSLAQYASRVFEQAAATAPRFAKPFQDAMRSMRGDTKEAMSVLIALEKWDYNSECLYAEYLVRQLTAVGIQAELLFTRGQNVFNRGDEDLAMPDVPFSFLYPKTRDIAHVHEALARRLATTSGSTVFVPFADSACFHYIGRLPANVAVLAVLRSAEDADIDLINGHARHINHIVCSSSAVRTAMLEVNAGLARKSSVVATTLAPDNASRESRVAGGTRRKTQDRIRLVCSAPGKIDVIIQSVALARQLRQRQVPFQIQYFIEPSEAVTLRSVAPDLLRDDTLIIHESPSMSERLALLADSDLLLALQVRDDGDLTLVEALATGCVPIVDDKIVEESKLLKPKINCLACRANDQIAIVRAIDEAIGDRGMLAKLARKAKSTAARGGRASENFADGFGVAVARAANQAEESVGYRAKPTKKQTRGVKLSA